MQRGNERADLLMVRGDSNDGVLMTQGGTLPRFENSQNVEMSADLLIEEQL
jgi:hypothetical protein